MVGAAGVGLEYGSDSVSNLLRRAERAVAESSRLRRVIEVLELRLIKTKNEVCPLVPPLLLLPPAHPPTHFPNILGSK